MPPGREVKACRPDSHARPGTRRVDPTVTRATRTHDGRTNLTGGVSSMTVLEPCPDLTRLRESLCTFPSRNLREALPFVAFATRCVRDVPPGSAHSASCMVTDSRLRSAFEAAERWLS